MMQQTSKKIDEVIRFFSDKSRANNKLLFVTGEFGTGKSSFLHSLSKEYFINLNIDALFRINDFTDIDFLPELLSGLKDNCRSQNNTQIKLSECDYHLSYFYGLLNQLHEKEIENLGGLINKLRCKNKFDLYRLDSVDEIEKNTYKKIIKDNFDNDLSRSYFKDINTILSEAFIVDMMNHFYSYDELVEICKTPLEIKPIKIYIVIDNYEALAGTVDRWLNSSFFAYCFNKTLHEFKYYDNSGINNLKISVLYDFHFILSGRFDFDKELKAEFSFASVRSEVLKFQNLNDLELQDYLKSKGSEDFEKAKEQTFGNPLLLDLFLKDSKSDNIKSDNIKDNIDLIASSYLARFSRQQQDWLSNAAFLDEIDLLSLRCLPDISNDYKDAYHFLKTSPLLVDDLEIKMIYKRILQEYVKSNDPELYKNITKLTEKCKVYSKIESSLGAETLEQIRSLAYFERIDEYYALDQFFLKDADKIRNIIKTNPDMFVKSEFTFSFNEEIGNALDELNQMFDADNYESTKQQVLSISDKRNKGIESDINDKQIKIQNTNKKLDKFRSDFQEKKLKYSENQRKLLEFDNNINDEPEKVDINKTERSRRLMFSSFGLTVLFVILGLFADTFFSSFFGQESSVTLLSYFLFLFAAMTLSFSGLLMLKRKGKIFSNKISDEELERIDALDKKKTDLHDETHNLKKEIEILDRNITEFEERIIELNNLIVLNQRKLKESYI